MDIEREQPKYKIGQEVVVTVITEHPQTKTEFSNEVNGWIMAITASGTSTKDTYVYTITKNLPACYCYGDKPFAKVMEDDIVLKNNKIILNKKRKRKNNSKIT